MRSLITFAASMLFTASVMAADPGVSVDEAWLRATMPGQDSGSMQFSVTSRKAAKLVAISTPAAGAVEIHSMVHEDGKMKMRAVESLALPAGKQVSLRSSGNHVMLLNLKHPLKAGDSVPFTLTVQYADNSKATVEAKAEVRPMGAGHDMKGMDDMKGMPGM
ncbi:MAG: copper chaperone PCu(A)C [Nitrosomonadales bacterium]|nr:copper chaperone PCu(A)C [Nitrosomonadales bacterium]